MPSLNNSGGDASHILQKLDKVSKTSTGWQARCPAHKDKNPSLSIGVSSDKILLKCQAGCDTQNIVSAIGYTMADLFTDKQSNSAPVIVATYDYHDEKGELAFQVIRRSDKTFRQRHPDKTARDGWAWNMDGVRRVLFRLPEILKAVGRGHPILIAEGEKDVLALVKRGFDATCNPGGACKWEDGYSESLRGADVVIVPDNDETGQKHAELVLSKLKGIAKSIRTIKLPIGKDAHDFFAGGGTAEQLITLIDKAAPAKTFAELVGDRKWNPNITPPAVRSIYAIGATPIATPGNIQTISAQVKTGKSAFGGGMIAAPMALDGADTFGICSSNPEGKAVLHFDTEHSTEDHWHHINRAKRRAGLPVPPPWLQSYCFTGFGAKQLRQAVVMATEAAAQTFCGIHSIHIDGVADMVCDVNDAEECNAFVAELHAFAIQYDCPIIGVIHLNPGTEKTRGHLGSQLERKAETNLRLDKDGDTTEVWSEKQRRAPIMKGSGPRFKWCDIAGMHVSVESSGDAKREARREEAKLLRDDVYNGRHAMRYSELLIQVQNTVNLSPSTSKRRLNEWVQLGIVEKSVAGLWIPKN